MKCIGVAIAAAGLYCLYHGYHPVFQPFQLGVVVSSSRVNGHQLLSKPFMRCVQYDVSRCGPLCLRKGSDCQRARCVNFCDRTELGIAYTCVVSMELGYSAYALDASELQTAGNRARAKEVCDAVFPLNSLYTVYTAFDYDFGAKPMSLTDLKKRVWLGYTLIFLALGILYSSVYANVFHLKKT